MTDNFDMNLTKKLTKRYRSSRKKDKQEILNEYCKITGVKRNTATQRLKRKSVLPSFPGRMKKMKQKKRGPKKRYLSFNNTMVRKCWELSGKICAERLTPMLSVYLESLKRAGKMKGYQEHDIQLVAHVSVSTIRRIIETFPEYQQSDTRKRKGKSTLYKEIPINARFGQEVTKPGYFEVDFVCHNGGNNQG